MKRILLTVLCGVVAAGGMGQMRPAMRSYSGVITSNTITHSGLFTVHQVRDSVFFEIPDSLLKREIMVISRLAQGPGLTGIFAGEELDEKTIQFEQGADSSIRIRYDLALSEADSSSNIYKAVANSNLNPVAYSFPIIAHGTGSSLIDATQLLNSNSFVNSLSSLSKTTIASSMKDFHIEFIHAYPQNVEINISKNLVNLKQEPVSVLSNTSFIVLPEIPMSRRLFDPRVGYFAASVDHFEDAQQKAETRTFICRWRMEPREEDVEKWKRGEVVEPKKPIVFYIDPATPKQWRKYLIMGIDDWQKAFEQAGFKNAIMGKEWQENDSINIDDARYSFLRYLPSPTANAYGPNIHDPRSGEIIQSHIGWYHNVMALVHDWYMIQAAATDPRARHAKFDEELMGQLIRFVSSHEVGHTLGLRHNFGSSSRTPVEMLRNKAWLDLHGHTASIMDYARFNYVAQPEDKIPEQDLFPRIGEYDKWAIQWGYKTSLATTEEADKKVVSKWIADSLTANPRLWWGNGEAGMIVSLLGLGDPRCLTEDLSDNVMRANSYGIMNLKRILPNLPAWTKEDEGLHRSLGVMLMALEGQFDRYMGHVLKQIPGVQETIRRDGDPGSYFEPVGRDRQLEALDFFDRELFTTPRWLLNGEVLNNVEGPFAKDFVKQEQLNILSTLMSAGILSGISANMARFGPQKSLSPEVYLATLHRDIWRELASGQAMDVYRRNLQKAYFKAFAGMLISNNADIMRMDIYTLAEIDLTQLQKEINAALPRFAGKMDRYHLQDLSQSLKKLLDIKPK